MSQQRRRPTCTPACQSASARDRSAHPNDGAGALAGCVSALRVEEEVNAFSQQRRWTTCTPACQYASARDRSANPNDGTGALAGCVSALRVEEEVDVLSQQRRRPTRTPACQSASARDRSANPNDGTGVLAGCLSVLRVEEKVDVMLQQRRRPTRTPARQYASARDRSAVKSLVEATISTRHTCAMALLKHLSSLRLPSCCRHESRNGPPSLVGWLDIVCTASLVMPAGACSSCCCNSIRFYW